MTRIVDLNCDLGEGFGNYRTPEDTALLDIVSSANIACGYHAGDPHTMRAAVERCVIRGVAIGAHPGLPDLLGFGRREMEVTAREVQDFVLYQTGALSAFARAAGASIVHVKPHGALYHMASRRADLAAAVAAAIHQLDRSIALVGPPGSELLRAAEAAGLRPIAEGFADRAYLANGSLVPRQMQGAVLTEPALVLKQALDLLTTGQVASIDGGIATVPAETLCVHSDTPGAAVVAARLRHGLEEAGFRIQSWQACE